jgi:hypothetical protein
MWRNTVTINNVLKKKITKLNFHSALTCNCNSYQLNIKKKLTKTILEKNKKNKKNYVRKNIVAIHSNLRGKLQCFPHIL